MFWFSARLEIVGELDGYMRTLIALIYIYIYVTFSSEVKINEKSSSIVQGYFSIFLLIGRVILISRDLIPHHTNCVSYQKSPICLLDLFYKTRTNPILVFVFPCASSSEELFYHLESTTKSWALQPFRNQYPS